LYELETEQRRATQPAASGDGKPDAWKQWGRFNRL
jgi:hypothetical protein